MSQWSQTFGSKLWRLTHFYKIRDKKKKLVKLKFNNIQKRIINAIEERHNTSKPIRHFDLKFRQGGVTTFWVLWYADDSIFHFNTVSAIMAHKQKSVNLIWEIARIAHEQMPSAVQPRLIDDSKSALSFDNHSKIFVSLEVESAAVHNLHISEYCLADEKKIINSLSATTPDANVTFESIGAGMNHGYDTYTLMRDSGEDGTALFHPWFIQEEYRQPLNGIEVVRTKEEEGAAKKAKVNHDIDLDDEQILHRRKRKKELKGDFPVHMAEDDETCFLTSGKFFFDNEKIARLIVEAKAVLKEREPIFEDDTVTIWEEYDKNCIYAAGADPADGGDPSVLAILNVTKRRTAMRFRGKVPAHAFDRICNKWGREYHALLGVELNNHGHAVIKGLIETFFYPWLFKNESRRPMIKKSGQVQKKGKYGWETTGVTRPLMLDQLKQALEGDFEESVEDFQPDIIVYDLILLGECLSFQDIDGKFQAVAGKTDDCVIAYAIAYQMALISRKGENLISGIVLGNKREAL